MLANVPSSISPVASSRVISLPRAFSIFCIRIASLFVANALDSSYAPFPSRPITSMSSAALASNNPASFASKFLAHFCTCSEPSFSKSFLPPFLARLPAPPINIGITSSAVSTRISFI